jgi:putative endonuclease
MGGLVSYHSGISAETAVAQHYARSGRPVAAMRWRGAGGEIDLIARDGAEVIFIEVKKARTHAYAAERVTERQMQRIMSAASEFLAGEPAGQGTAVRFDVALVDVRGQIDIIENAFAA